MVNPSYFLSNQTFAGQDFAQTRNEFIVQIVAILKFHSLFLTNKPLMEVIYENGIKVRIQGSLHADYSCYLWPSALVLAEFLYTHCETYVQGKSILELGSGTSLPGILCGQLGSKCVILTDKTGPWSHSSAHSPHHANISEDASSGPGSSLDVVRQAVRINLAPSGGLCGDALSSLDLVPRNCLSFTSMVILGLNWGKYEEDGILRLIQSPVVPNIDVIIGADIFFDSDVYEPILASVALLLRRFPNCIFLTTYQERSSKHCIQSLLTYWGLKGQCHNIFCHCQVGEAEEMESWFHLETCISRIRNVDDGSSVVMDTSAFHSIFLLEISLDVIS